MVELAPWTGEGSLVRMRRRSGDASQTRARRRSLLAQLSSPLRDFLGTESGSAGLVLSAALVALPWANSPWSASYESLWSTNVAISVDGSSMSMNLEHWLSDGLMVLCFFVIGLEVRRDFAVGELTDRRRAVVPALAGVADTFVPALLYVAVNGGGEAADAWAW